MKKRFISVIMVLAMMLMMLTGCGGKEEEAQVSEAAEPVYMTFDGYGFVWGIITYTEEDGQGGRMESESVSLALSGIPGETVGKAWAEAGYEFVDIAAENDEFEGWMIYDMHMETDEEGIDTYNYERVSGDTFYSTEELMEMEIPDFNVSYVAKWKSTPVEDYDAEFALMSESEEVEETPETFVVMDADGGLMKFAAEDPYETDIYIYYIANGQSVYDVMYNGWDDAVEDIYKDGAEFAGWTIYEGDYVDWPEEEQTDLAEGSQCFSVGEYMYLTMDNCVVHSEGVSTEELQELVCEGKSYYVVANWK